MVRPKIYDCFAFFNELDLLEIRLIELYDVVDYFVIVESTVKHNGEEKPLYFEENKKRFKKWEKKIIHIVADDAPKLNFLDWFNVFWENKKVFTANKIGRNFVVGKWKLDYWQKNQTARGLGKAGDDDIIFLSDADEIVSGYEVRKVVSLLDKNPNKIVRMNNKCFYYYLNGRCSLNTIGHSACKYKLLRDKLNNQPQRMRENYGFKNWIRKMVRKGKLVREIVVEGGWHFSFLGGIEKIQNKLGAMAHSEFDREEYKNAEKIKKRISEGGDIFDRGMTINYIKISENFPIAIKKNHRRYNHIIKNVKNS